MYHIIKRINIKIIVKVKSSYLSQPQYGVNKAINNKDEMSKHDKDKIRKIGLLDIFGFENFENNSNSPDNRSSINSNENKQISQNYDNLNIPEINCKSINIQNDQKEISNFNSVNKLDNKNSEICASNLHNQNGNFQEKEILSDLNFKEEIFNTNTISGNSNNKEENEEKINLLQNEIKSLRKIIDEFRKKELLENDSMLKLEISNLKNLMKNKENENEILADENKNLKKHIEILQENVDSFLKEFDDKEIEEVESDNNKLVNNKENAISNNFIIEKHQISIGFDKRLCVLL